MNFKKFCIVAVLAVLAVLTGQLLNAAIVPGAEIGWNAFATGGGVVVVGMLLPEITYIDDHSDLNPASAALLGKTKRRDIEVYGPLESIDINLYLKANGTTAPSSFTADGIMGVLKNVKVNVTEKGHAQRPLVDCSGVFLLEYCSHIKTNLDAATLQLLTEMQKGSPALQTADQYLLQYHIPLVHPQITHPLRMHNLVPIHRHVSQPTIELTFAPAADMYSAGSLDEVLCEVIYNAREMDDAATEEILKTKVGFLRYDIIEYSENVPVGTTSDWKFKINPPGRYAGMMFRMYKGGASVTRGDISSDTVAPDDTKWVLKSGTKVHRTFKMRHQRMRNDRTRPLNSATLTSSPSIGPKLATDFQYQDVSSVYLDFIADEGNEVNDLGSLFDTDEPAKNNLECQIVGKVANAATNGHEARMGGHRFLDSEIVKLW